MGSLPIGRLYFVDSRDGMRGHGYPESRRVEACRPRHQVGAEFRDPYRERFLGGQDFVSIKECADRSLHDGVDSNSLAELVSEFIADLVGDCRVAPRPFADP